MKSLRAALPAFPPLEDEQAVRLLRVLRVVAYLGLLASVSFLILLSMVEFRPQQIPLVNIQRVVLVSVLVICLVTVPLMRRGHVRIGGAMQIFALWLSLTLVPNMMGIPLHVVAANHIALAICVGPLLGWTGALTLGVASFIFMLIQDSGLVVNAGLAPLLPLNSVQVFIIQLALYGMMLAITMLIVFLSQRRSEISQVTAEALEVATYSEKKLESIIESMADVLLLVDTTGAIIKANRAAFTLLGYTETELSGKPLRTLLLDIPDANTGVESMSRNQIMRHVSKRLRTKDGRILPVSLSSAIMPGVSGQPAGIILVAQDMTELEAIRQRLDLSNKRFNLAVTFSNIGVFEFDMERGEFFIEDTMRQAMRSTGMDGFTNYEAFLALVFPEDRQRVNQTLEDYRAGKTDRIDVEFRIETIRGVRWIMVRGAVQPGSGPRLIGTFMDVTRRKRAELALARRDEVLRAITAASEAFLRTSDWERHIPNMLRELGQAAQVSRVYVFQSHTSPDGRLLASQIYEWCADGVTPQTDNPAMQNFDIVANGFSEMSELMRAGRPIYGLVSSMDAHIRAVFEAQDIVSIAAMPIFVQGEWWGYIGFDDCWAERIWNEPELDALQLAADSLGAAITRQRVEANLQENRDFLMSIMTNLGQGVTVVDGEGRLLFANPAFAEYTGVPPEKMLGHTIDEFVEITTPEAAEQGAVREHDKTTAYPLRIRHIDGTQTTDLFVNSVPRFVDGKPDGAYAVSTNLTEQHRLEENRMQLAFEREQMRIMADFVRDASHDFRTPLSIIQTSLYLLRRKAESPEQLERLQTVGFQANRLSRLIDGLLTMLELDQANVTLIPINLKTVAQNAIDRSRDAAHKGGLALDLNAPDEGIFVNGEEGYLMKAVANLIDNAIAFTAAGGYVKVTLRADDDHAELLVSDNGVGIAPDEHQRIFERLYKVDKARTIDSGGLGMGLAITKRIMELHGGTVSVDSTPGKGSQFTLSFTRVKQSPSRPRQISASPITEDMKMGPAGI